MAGVARWLTGLPAAALVTLGLFALMAGMISMERAPGETRPQPEINILPRLIETAPQPAPPAKPKIIDEAPPPVERTYAEPGDKPGPVIADPDQISTEGEGAIETGRIVAPLIRHAPPYPESCRARGVSGVVIVQFDVTPEGNVVNVRVIDAPDRCFRRIAGAIARWKYPPSYENGRPVMRYGVVERFSFELTD
ncbi:MAG: energy transducer TonB [Hyphococcus sp.]